MNQIGILNLFIFLCFNSQITYSAVKERKTKKRNDNRVASLLLDEKLNFKPVDTKAKLTSEFEKLWWNSLADDAHLLENRDYFLRLELNRKVGENGLQSLTWLFFRELNAKFTSASTPFSGEVSTVDQCNEDSLPLIEKITVNNRILPLFFAEAGSPYIIGPCSANKKKRWGLATVYIRPKKRAVVQITLVDKKKSTESASKAMARLKDVISKIVVANQRKPNEPSEAAQQEKKGNQ